MKNLLHISILALALSSCGFALEEGYEYLDEGIFYKQVVKNDEGAKIEYGTYFTVNFTIADKDSNILLNTKDSSYGDITMAADTTMVEWLTDPYLKTMLTLHENDIVTFKGNAEYIFPLQKEYDFNLNADDEVYFSWELKEIIESPRVKSWTVYPPDSGKEIDIHYEE